MKADELIGISTGGKTSLCVFVFGDTLYQIDKGQKEEQSELRFLLLTSALKTKLYVIWKKYQVFSPAAELLLNEMKSYDRKSAPLE